MPMIRKMQARGRREARDHRREIEDAGDEREQHVEERGPGARVAVDGEEAPERGARRLARRRRERRAHLLLGRAIGRGDFFRRAVGARNELERIGLAAAGIRRHLGAQVFLGVVERVLHERGILARERGAQGGQVLLDRAGGGAFIHEEAPFASVNPSTKSRVLRQIPRHSARRRAPGLGDPVVAARRASVRRDDSARQQAIGRQLAKHGIEGALLDGRAAVREGLQALGDLVAVQVFLCLVEDREQHEADQSGVQFPLKFKGKSLLFFATLARSPGWFLLPRRITY